MMKVIRNILLSLVAVVLLPIILAQAPSEWKLNYSVSRLIYSVDVPPGYDNYIIVISIPHDFLDNLANYFNATGFNVTNFITDLYPRVYYVNQTSGEQIQIPCRDYNVQVDEGVPFCVFQNYYNTSYGPVPDMLLLYFDSNTIATGTNYFILYYPALYWEDWETEYLGHTITSAGQCFNNGWCIYTAFGGERHYAKIVSNGWEPTIRKAVLLEASGNLGEAAGVIIYKDLNISITPLGSLIAEWDIGGTDGTDDYSIIFQFRFKDGSIKSIKYIVDGGDSYSRPEFNICKSINVGSGHIARDLLIDMIRYCGVSPYTISKLERVYIQAYDAPQYGSGGYVIMKVDTIKILPTYMYS